MSQLFAHPSAIVDEPSSIGSGTKLWHFCHVMRGARIGRNCTLGQGVFVASGVQVGDGVKIQNNVSLYEGTIVEDEVFLGPSCVITNVTNPRAALSRRGLFEATRIRRGATIGANATIVSGVTIGRHAFVAAGALVRADVDDYVLIVGVPGRPVAWMSRHGHKLCFKRGSEERCAGSGLLYRKDAEGKVICVDLAEEAQIPGPLLRDLQPYRSVEKQGER